MNYHKNYLLFLSTRVELDFLGWNDIDIFSH